MVLQIRQLLLLRSLMLTMHSVEYKSPNASYSSDGKAVSGTCLCSCDSLSHEHLAPRLDCLTMAWPRIWDSNPHEISPSGIPTPTVPVPLCSTWVKSKLRARTSYSSSTRYSKWFVNSFVDQSGRSPTSAQGQQRSYPVNLGMITLSLFFLSFTCPSRYDLKTVACVDFRSGCLPRDTGLGRQSEHETVYMHVIHACTVCCLANAGEEHSLMCVQG